MPRSAGTAVENNFSRALITEATGLNFPENACTETYDCVFLQTGQVQRRPGFDLEEDWEYITYNTSTGVVKEFVWRVGGSTNKIFQVVQLGSTIRFFEVDGASLSPNLESFTIDLLSYDTGSDVEDYACNFASGNGLLFVAHPFVEPLMVEYNSGTNTITVTQLSLKIRDFTGVDDGLAVDTQPNTLSDAHNYNLKNQGWYPATVNCVNASNAVSSANPITHWESVDGDYPANNHIWWAYKRARNDNSSKTYEEVFDPTAKAWIKVGNTPAPKGHYILNAFNQDRTTASGVSNIATVTSGGARPQAVAFFAGRAFWGGVAAQGFHSKIYFSQVVERNSQVALCYQDHDPTDEDVPDLLPTDGGVISIPEMRQLLMMMPLADSLFLFATNGVWKISGSEGIGFRANDYSIMKVSDVGAISALSFVLVENMPVWWNHAGIWTLATENGIDYTVQSMTDKSIKEFFENIPNDSKLYAKGAYNSQTKIIQWLYSSTEHDTDTPSDTYNYDRILNLNTLTGAFYPWTITSAKGSVMRGITAVEGELLEQELEVVQVGDEDIFVGEEEVFLPVSTFRAVQSLFKYILHVDGAGITFADCARIDYRDWPTLAAQNYTSYFVTGYRVNADGDKRFQSNYVTMNYMSVPDNSAFLQGIWDYSLSGDTGRWSSQQQITINDEAYKFLMAKRKIRGNGRSLQLKVTSESGKPFAINGWTIFLTGNQVV
jgi:hypothetical protein